MARRTKANKIEIEVEEALEEALNFDVSSFDETALQTINVDDLAQQIASATAETTSESDLREAPAVDESVATHLFNKQPQNTKDKNNSAKNRSQTASGTARNSNITYPYQPANDDQHIFSQRNFAKKTRSSKIYWNTTALSALWAVGGSVIAGNLASTSPSAFSLSSFLSSPIGIGVLAGTAVPIMMFWGFAHLIKRAKDLQSAVQSITEASFQAFHPKNNEPAQIMQLGSKVRQEVAAMNEGIEKTLARAAELEALVHGEVQNLERAYSDNENRVHLLMRELSNEREAISSHANRLKVTLKNTRDDLSEDFRSITSDISSNVENVARQITNKLESTAQGVTFTNEHFLGELNQRFEETRTYLSKSNTDLVNNFQNTLEDIEGRADSINRLLSTTTTKTLSDLDHSFDKIDSRLIDHSDYTLNVFDNKLASLNEAASEAIAAFGNKLSELDSTVNNRSIKSIHLVDEKITALSTTANNAISTFDGQFENLQTSLNAHNEKSLTTFNEHFTALQNRSQAMSDKFDLTTEETMQAFEKRLIQLDNNLGEQSKSIVYSLINRAESLEENTEKLAGMLDLRAAQINDTLKERTAEIVKTFSGGRDDFLSTVKGNTEKLAELLDLRATQVNDTLTERTSELASTFSGERDNFLSAVNGMEEKLQDRIIEIEQSISDIFDERSESLISNLEKGSDLLSTLMQNETSRVVDAIQEQINMLSGHVLEIEQTLINNTSTFDKNAREHSEAFDSQAKNLQESIANSFKTAKDAIDTQTKNLDVRADSLRDSLVVNSSVLDEVLAEQAHVLEERIQRILSLIAKGDLQFDDSINKHLSSFKRVFSDNNAIIEESLEGHLKTLQAHTDMLKNAINHSNELKVSVDSQKSSLDDAFSSQISLLEERTTTMRQALETGVIHARDSLEENTSDIASSLHKKITEAIGTLTLEAKSAEEIVDTLGGKLSSSISQFETSLSQAHSNIFEDSKLIAENLKNNIHGVTGNITTTLTEAGEQLSLSIKDASTLMEQRLADRSTSFNETVKNLGWGIDDQVDAMDQRISQNIHNITDKTQHAFNLMTQNLSEQLSTTIQTARERLNSDNEALVNALSQRATKTIESINDIGNSLNSRVDSLVGQLDQSMDNIHKSANLLMSGFKQIDGRFLETAHTLYNKTDEIAKNLSSSSNHLANNVQSLQGVSKETIEHIKSLTVNFDEHANILSKATKFLDYSQNNFSATLEERQKALFTLSEGLAEKSQKITETILHYEKVISNALANTDSHTTRSVKDMQRKLVELINDASSRFSDASKQVKQSAQQIRTEMLHASDNMRDDSATQVQLTQKSTQAMRQAVDDQMTALQKLASAFNGSSNQTAGSNVAVAEKPNPQLQNRQTQPTTKNSSQHEKTGWVSDLLTRASHNGLGKKSRSTENSEKKYNYSFQSSPQNSFRSAKQTPNTLNELSSNIVRAINHNSLVELWNYYRRGQRNIVEHRLYNQDGLKIFNNIKKMYESDASFRSTAKKYIIDFERLLREVYTSGNDKNNIRDYLISDTGKIYTMLAHVSGRIQ